MGEKLTPTRNENKRASEYTPSQTFNTFYAPCQKKGVPRRWSNNTSLSLHRVRTNKSVSLPAIALSLFPNWHAGWVVLLIHPGIEEAPYRRIMCAGMEQLFAMTTVRGEITDSRRCSARIQMHAWPLFDVTVWDSCLYFPKGAGWFGISFPVAAASTRTRQHTKLSLKMRELSFENRFVNWTFMICRSCWAVVWMC